MLRLQDMRNHKHLKWPVRIFFAIVIISFIFFYGWSSNESRQQRDAQRLARLRSESIHPLRRWDYITPTEAKMAKRQAEFAKARLLGPQYMQILFQNNMIEKLVDQDDILRTAANNNLLERKAEKLGLTVTTDDVVARLAAQPGISDEQLEAEARESGTDKWGLIEMMRQSEEAQRIRNLQGLLAHASLFELWQEYSLAHEKITLNLAAYPASDFEKKVNVTDADLEKYLADHRDQFHRPEMRRYAFVKVAKADILKNINPTTETLQAYYDQNKAQYVEKAKIKTEEIFTPLNKDLPTTAVKALESVRAEAAKQDNWTSISQELTKQHPGMKFLRNEMTVDEGSGIRPEEYVARITTLADNQVSTPIVTSSGVYMVRVKQRVPERTPSLAEVRDKVLEDYKSKQADDQLAKTAEKFQAESKKLQADKATTNTIQRFAQDLGLKDELTTAVKTTDAMIPSLGNLGQDKAYIDTLALGELSEPIQTSDLVAVVQVADVTPARDPDLKEIRADVEKAVRKSRAVELAKAAAEQGLNIVKGGGDFKNALAQAPKPPIETKPFTREEPVDALGAPMIDFDKETMKIATGSTGLSPYGYDSKTPQGYAVWQVKKIEPPTQQQFTADRQKFEQQYLQVQNETIVSEWLADQRRAAQFQILNKEDKAEKEAKEAQTAKDKQENKG